MNKKPLISLQNIVKKYNNSDVTVINDLSLDIEDGAFITILGPSGCGKSTLLKMIGGFELPTKGRILLNGLDIKDMPVYRRPVATVFQDYALFPTMNVFQNISYGLKKVYISLDHVSNEALQKVQEKKNAAEIKAAAKLKDVAQKKVKLTEKLNLEKTKLNELNPKTLIYKFKKTAVDSLENELDDLDYWTSYWQTYPLTMKEKYERRYTKRKLTKQEIAKKVYDVIEMVGLKGKEYMMPYDLSGGMQQRVALARAIVTSPKILLLDEPLSALDAKVRKQMQEELKRIHEKLKITFILVTHDQEEALVLSDKVVVMSKGVIEQLGTPSEVYDSPANIWVSNFIGKANLFDGIYVEPGLVNMEGYKFYTDVTTGFEKNQKVTVMIRPEDYDVVKKGKGIIDVYVEQAIYKGQLWELKCKFKDKTVYVENIDEVKVGQEIGLVWDQIDVHVMNRN